MTALIRYELQKIWTTKSFICLIMLILCLNVFLLWYLNEPSEYDPPLSAYRAVCRDISDMTESEKLDYITGLKEQAQADDISPVYTDTVEQEQSLIDELYNEITAVTGYDDYLETVQENSVLLSGISIFKSETTNDSFSARNIKKSAADHSGLSSENIRWFPSKGIKIAVQNQVTDLLLILSVFLFVGQLVTAEKERGLFAITRASKRGMCIDMAAKLFALLIHCGAFCLLLYGSNLIYSECVVGLGDLSASLQSVPSYIDSSLPLSLAGFLGLGLLTKTAALFLLGLLLAAFAVYSSHNFVPQLAGIIFLGASRLLYALIPSYSGLNVFKYLSYFGLLNTEELYGNYINLNVFGFPVSRITCAAVVLSILILLGITAVLLLFCHGNHLTLTRTESILHFPFRPHGSLFRHESYKLLIMNRVLLILLVFVFLIARSYLGNTYVPSSGEQYYQNIMLSLEGELTGEKETLIASEKARYDEALAQIDRIDESIAEGNVDEETGERMKEQWYRELAFYSYFQRIEAQYDRISENGGVFIYETGWLYLFGKMNDCLLTDLLLISICAAFAFSNVMSMEDSKGIWELLSATRCGRKKIIICKCILCGLISTGITLLPWIFRYISLRQVYPMAEITAGIQSIPQYENSPLNIPVGGVLIIALFVQTAAVGLISSLILLLSKWRKNYFQTLFLSLLLFAVPLILAEMGLDIMKWFSVWVIYGWTGI